MLKRLVTAVTIAAMVATSAVMVSAATIPSSGTTTIYPNKLTITWADGSKAPVTINTFRFYGYNVAQLRTMVNALGGAVNLNQDGTYQVSTIGGGANYTDIGFTSQQDISYTINTTPIRDVTGTLVYPNEPGWVFLPDYNYNWASIRDIIQAMGYSLASVNDNPAAGTTSIVVNTGTASGSNVPPVDWAPVLTPGSGSYGYITPYNPTPVTAYNDVAFNLSGAPGPVPATQRVQAGQLVVRPADPTWAGYTFAGWWNISSDGTSELWDFDNYIPTSSGTLYAKWTPVIVPPVTEWTVTFDYQMPSGQVLKTTATVADQTTVAKPADPTCNGYIFAGWNTQADGKGSSWNFATSVTADQTLYAIWTPVVQPPVTTNWTVTFAYQIPSGQALTTTSTVADQQTVAKPTDPTCDGYTFIGWNTQADGKGNAWDFATDKVAADTTLYAIWIASGTPQPGELTVTFVYQVPSGSSLGVDKVSVVSGNPVSKPSPDPTCSGYTFSGWSTDPNAGPFWDFSTPITTPIVLYGIWVPEGTSEATVEGYVTDNSGHDVPFSPDVTAPNGSIASDALGVLPGSAYAMMSDGSYVKVTVSWAFDTAFNDNDVVPAGKYAVTGTTSDGGLVNGFVTVENAPPSTLHTRPDIAALLNGDIHDFLTSGIDITSPVYDSFMAVVYEAADYIRTGNTATDVQVDAEYTKLLQAFESVKNGGSTDNTGLDTMNNLAQLVSAVKDRFDKGQIDPLTSTDPTYAELFPAYNSAVALISSYQGLTSFTPAQIQDINNAYNDLMTAINDL